MTTCRALDTTVYCAALHHEWASIVPTTPPVLEHHRLSNWLTVDGQCGQVTLTCVIPACYRHRKHSSRPASTASLSTGKGTSCGPLVCLCYTRVAMHGRSFPSARVIVVVLPLPSVLNVFQSVEPTTIVNVCIQFAGFEQN